MKNDVAVLALAGLAAGLLIPKTATYKDDSPGLRFSRLASPILVSWRSSVWP